MGFQRGRVTLKWSEQHDLHGLEIVMRRKPLGEVFEGWLSEDGDKLADRPWDERSAEERVEISERNASEFAALIVEWNLEDDDGRPVILPTLPSVGDSARPAVLRRRGRVLLQHCDVDMIDSMRLAYSTATARVSPPLPTSSGPGPGASSSDPKDPADSAPMPEDWSMPAQEPLHVGA